MCDFLDYRYDNDGQGLHMGIRLVPRGHVRRWNVVMLFCVFSFESHVLLCMFWFMLWVFMHCYLWLICFAAGYILTRLLVWLNLWQWLYYVYYFGWLMCNSIVFINVLYFHVCLVYVSVRLIFATAFVSYIAYVICCIFVILVISSFVSFLCCQRE